jgi:uncharacterized protein YbjT (DUF2867 family)
MILVTGGTGGIGSELPGITWVAGDLARPETLGLSVQGCRASD